jgi:hypothetical protein
MADQKLHGKFGKVFFAGWPPGGTPVTATLLPNAHKSALSTAADIEDATDFNSGGWLEFICGNRKLSGTIDGWWNSGETKLFGSAATPGAIFGGNSAVIQLWVDAVGHPNESFTFPAILGNADFEIDVKGNVSWTIAFQSNGAPTAFPMA